jgi:prepilin-type processing-associated H-X9-DG protein
LVELLVVIGIIALLISILLPSLQNARKSAIRVACASNLRQLGQFWHMYAGQWKGNFPDPNQGYGTWELWPNFMKNHFIDNKYGVSATDGRVFYCPAHRSLTGGDASSDDWTRPSGSSAPDTVLLGYTIYASNYNALQYAKSWYPDDITVRPPYKANEKDMSERPIIMDMLIDYSAYYPGVLEWDYSAHLKNRVPEGRNACFGDGHVAWRPFDKTGMRSLNPVERW